MLLCPGRRTKTDPLFSPSSAVLVGPVRPDGSIAWATSASRTYDSRRSATCWDRAQAGISGGRGRGLNYDPAEPSPAGDLATAGGSTWGRPVGSLGPAAEVLRCMRTADLAVHPPRHDRKPPGDLAHPPLPEAQRRGPAARPKDRWPVTALVLILSRSATPRREPSARPPRCSDSAGPRVRHRYRHGPAATFVTS